LKEQIPATGTTYGHNIEPWYAPWRRIVERREVQSIVIKLFSSFPFFLDKKREKKSSLKEIPGGKNFELAPIDIASLMFIQHTECHFDDDGFSHRAQTRSFHTNNRRV